MDYLERNYAVLQEMQSLHNVTLGKQLGKSLLHSFYAAGRYYSPLLRKNLCVGVKTHNLQKDMITFSFEHSLRFLRALQQHAPELAAELPSCYGLLKDKNGLVGIVTEDFSRNATVRFGEIILPDDIPASFYRIARIEHDGMKSFFLNGRNKRMLADIDHIALHKQFDIRIPKEWYARYTIRNKT